MEKEIEKPKIYRIWHFTSNDRSEIARVQAYSFEAVQQFLLEQFIKEDFREQVEQTDYGIEWDSMTPQECLKAIEKDYLDEKEKEELEEGTYNPCEHCCDGCLEGFQIEEIDYDCELDFKTIYGTNEAYVIDREGNVTKKEDWNKQLAIISKIDFQKGIDFLTAMTLAELHKEALKKKGTENPRKLSEINLFFL